MTLRPAAVRARQRHVVCPRLRRLRRSRRPCAQTHEMVAIVVQQPAAPPAVSYAAPISESRPPHKDRKRNRALGESRPGPAHHTRIGSRTGLKYLCGVRRCPVGMRCRLPRAARPPEAAAFLPRVADPLRHLRHHVRLGSSNIHARPTSLRPHKPDHTPAKVLISWVRVCPHVPFRAAGAIAGSE